MSDQILKDKMNRTLGVIKTDSYGVQTVYDPMNRRKGSYDPRTNITRDAMNRIIGKGNLLATLLTQNAAGGKQTADQILKDKMNRTLGVIKTDSYGVQTVYDPMNRRKGSYDPRTNITRDAMNRIIGKGNLLVTLL